MFSRLAARLAPQETLSRQERVEGLGWLIRNGVASQAMETLSIGVFLVAYAVSLGASNFYIGLLAALPHLTQIAQIPGVLLVERFRRRKLICVIAASMSRPMLLLSASAVLLPAPEPALVVLAVGVAGRYLLGAIVGSGWNAWIRDLVPQDRMGEIFARRLALMTFAGTALSMVAALFIDQWSVHGAGPPGTAYAILLIGAFVAGAYSVWGMTRIPEERMTGEPLGTGWLRLLGSPLRDANFRRLVAFLASWNFAVNLAAPFFTVHMLQALGLDLTLVIGLTVMSQLANVLVLRKWGAIADRFSNKAVLAFSGPVFIGCIFAWTFTTFPDSHFLTLPLLVAIHILTGFATAGVTLAAGNIGMKLAPRGEAAPFLATLSLTNALAAGMAPVFGGLLADYFVTRELAVVVQWTSPSGEVVFDALNIRQWDFFFLTATMIGLFSIHQLARVREEGEVDEHIVLAEWLLGAKRTVRNLSSVAGLRSATEFPFEALRRSLRRRNRRRRLHHGHDAPDAEPPDPEARSDDTG